MTELEALVVNNMIFVGDFKQQGPTVSSEKTEHPFEKRSELSLFEKSLFEPSLSLSGLPKLASPII